MTIKRIPGNARMSSAVLHNGTIYTRGVTPLDVSGTIEAQTRDVLDQLDEIVVAAGSEKSKVLKVMIWLTDMRDFEAMNAVYDAWLASGDEPVRACVETTLADRDMKIEIQMEAAA